jgi:hypothetical protein
MVRPVQESDVVLMQEMHTRLSKESVYYRYLAPRKPSQEAVQSLCFLDGQPGLAIVATVQESQEKIDDITYRLALARLTQFDILDCRAYNLVLDGRGLARVVVGWI